ncbi:MAG: aspartate/glutamate racemase family protein [Alistipes shahii]
MPGDPQRGGGSAGHRTEPRRRAVPPHGRPVRQRHRSPDLPGHGFRGAGRGDREDTPEAEAAVRAAVEPMLARGADQIVLGCTHYPFLTPVMERIVDGRAAIVDPSPAVARRVGQLLDRYGLRASADNRPALTFRTFADELYRLRLERKVAAYL